MGRLLYTLIRVAGLLSVGALLLNANTIDPQCSSPSTDMVAMSGSSTTFCVSDYGWSNGWFATGAPGDYPANTSSNLLADNAQAVSYTLGGTTYTNWISPYADGKHTNSDFTIVTPVTVSNGVATSVITDGRVDVTVTSTVVNNNLQQTFKITNLTNQTLTNINFFDYFNYFPYGAGNPTLGTLTYNPVQTVEGNWVYGLWASGTWGSSGFIRDGGICGGIGTSGCTTPTGHEIGTPNSVFQDVGLGATLNGSNSGSNDVAGALSWDASGLSLGNGASQSFTIELVPEPETIALLLIGLAGIYVGRRKF
ncbi:MAG TPA: PEP-CTERM sorting domain-containing protein [Bryobacteraceae bacterium]|nr:PEP-CTERM sorting domain-containing protein [Bryobacteraceae bacterium]